MQIVRWIKTRGPIVGAIVMDTNPVPAKLDNGWRPIFCPTLWLSAFRLPIRSPARPNDYLAGGNGEV